MQHYPCQKVIALLVMQQMSQSDCTQPGLNEDSCVQCKPFPF